MAKIAVITKIVMNAKIRN